MWDTNTLSTPESKNFQFTSIKLILSEVLSYQPIYDDLVYV